ncbi:CHAD domain-containing protein [Amycolatopsis sp. FDAARGOS 1241]|uniref:CHAD domain-containing protein n=1 Tax=Amycolatopsis sp. FDAARGOS 1241 TaxID=2778070 RepID=UPI00194FB4B9|nr:CHAD domain-containing protein [Amycolatopsis sp. FDAARGOS 1241]QRP45097.1 CHAD domain-containing protein [Amycolatopsis sp. FDAARGOS 1241]
MTTEAVPSSTRRRAPEPTTPAELGLPEKPATASPRDPAATHIRAKLDHELRELLAREAGTRSGADPEDLHQMRVALRRMRSVLKTSGSLIGPTAEPVRVELGWLGQSLGEVRDYDVLIGHLREVIAGFDVRDQAAGRRLVSKFVTERSAARRRLTRALSSARYSALLQSVAQLTRTPDHEIDSAPIASGDLAADVRKPFRRLDKAVRTLPADPPDDDLHTLRIYGKKLRYTAELARSSAKKKQALRLADLVKATRKLQTVLGDHQDAVVAADRVRGLLPDADGEIGFIAGRIAEHELAKRAEARAAWPAVWSQVAKTADAAL